MNYKFDDKRPFIFISYSHCDKELVVADVERLSNKGVNLWYDANMSEGYSWQEFARPIINDDDCMAVLFYASYASIISQPCYEELCFAKGKFDRFTSRQLAQVRDFNKHSSIKQKSKKIISVDLMNGSVSSVIESLLQSAKTDTTIVKENIEFIKEKIFQDFKVLYSVYKDDGDHIDRLVMGALKNLPRDVIIFENKESSPVPPDIDAPEEPQSSPVTPTPKAVPVPAATVTAPPPPPTMSPSPQEILADSPGSAEDLQNRFRNWFLENRKSEAAAKRYINQIRGTLVKGLKAEDIVSVNLFEYGNTQIFQQVCDTIQSLPGFIMRNSAGHNDPKSALNAYANFLESLSESAPTPAEKSAAAFTFNHTVTKTDVTYRLIRFKKSTGIHELFSPNMPVTVCYKDIEHETKIHAIELGRISSVPFIKDIPVGTELSVTFDGVNRITLTDVVQQGQEEQSSGEPIAPPPINNDVEYVEKTVSENDIKTRILRIPKKIISQIDDNTYTAQIIINDDEQYQLNINSTRTYFGGVTDIFKKYELLSSDGVATPKTTKWFYDAKKNVVHLYI